MTTSNYYVLDLETTVNNTSKFKKKCGLASPHYWNNRIVATGILKGNSMEDKWEGELPKLFHERNTICNMLQNDNLIEVIYPWNEEEWFKEVAKSKIIVGHNIAFDILYILKNETCNSRIDILREALMKEPVLLWDTMLVEHMLSGQQWKYPSLDDVSRHYGLEVKPTQVKELWEAGVKTEDMDKDMLLKYLNHDVMVTDAIFKKQLDLVDRCDQKNIVFDELRSRMATIMMEYNGTPFDEDLAKQYLVEIETELSILRENFITRLQSINYNVNFTEEFKQTINLSSPQQVSKMLFGGSIDWTETVVDKDKNGKPIVYKSGIKKGLSKWKKVTNRTTLGRLFTPKAKWQTSKSGIYSTSDSIITEVLSQSNLWYTQEIIEDIQEYRKLTKESDTYLTGLLRVCWDGGLLHPTFNHVETPTGRLSCRNPNIQNITAKR
tara:strand:- start:3469 stop:4779 length:1311 start_codon:yes stop_codon:yes gene_type:complete